jgi:rhamnulokinase
MAERRFAAVDLGAQSGRVASAVYDGDHVSLELVHRFANRAVTLPDGLHWNVIGLLSEVVDGLGRAAASGPLDGIGIDSWGCDYALLDAHGRMLGVPFSHRDPRRSAPEVVSRVLARVPAHALYAATGTQLLAINTAFQLSSELEDQRLQTAARIALIPELLGYWLTGSLVNEMTSASTTGLLRAGDPSWDTELVSALGLPQRLFEADLARPGTELGNLLPEHGIAGTSTVRAVAGHDTASAFAAAPLDSPHAAVLSSGTWSLLGVNVDAPALGPDAERFNLTNERAADGRIMLRRNVMGMWLVEECRRELGSDSDYEQLWSSVRAISGPVPVFDPDHQSLLVPGAISPRVAALCRASRQPVPVSHAATVKSILVSLACKYRLVLEQLEQVTGRRIDRIQIVGGGSRNELLCQLSANISGRLVAAGPTEATLTGNALVQLHATGEIASLAEGRELCARSVKPIRYEPVNADDGEATYQQFLEVTGLQSPRPVRAGV